LVNFVTQDILSLIAFLGKQLAKFRQKRKNAAVLKLGILTIAPT
jgi:hypothetical protein